VRGSVGIVTIVSCAIFAALTGSGAATVTAIGAIMMPALTASNYSKSTACGILAAGGCLGPIIPPSIPMLVYGSNMRVSIPAMFMGGLLPGLLLTSVYLGVHHYYVRHRWDITVTDTRYTFKEKLRITWRALPALFMPVIILGGIYGGVFTPTESAAVAVFYTTLLGFVTRTLTVRIFVENIQRTSVMSAAIAASLGCGYIFTYLMGTTGIPAAVTNAMVPLMGSAPVFLLIMSLILFVAGCLLDMNIVIILMGPILAPVGIALGIDPLHIGVAFCTNIIIGAITPPFGGNLFTATRVSGESYESVVRGVVPFMAAALVTVLFITFCPPLTTWLPHKLGL
jgi:C4-dicarboxylate transporter DctM subunit